MMIFANREILSSQETIVKTNVEYSFRFVYLAYSNMGVSATEPRDARAGSSDCSDAGLSIGWSLVLPESIAGLYV